MTEIAVIGAGAIGGTLAAHLLATGRHRVTVCARTPIDEITVETPAGTLRATPAVVTEPSAVHPVPWVILATKAHQTAGAAEWLKACTAHETIVAVAQNGVEHRARVTAFTGDASILPVVVECPASRTAPGRIVQRGAATLVVPDSDAGRSFQALFELTAVTVSTTADFTTASWRKLCLNAAGGAITAIANQPMGVLRTAPATELARAIIAEAIAVGRAEGAVLPDAFAAEIIAALHAAPTDAMTSMLSDRRAGLPLEWDARNGAIVRLGERHGIPTPANRAIITLLRNLGPPRSRGSPP